MSAPFGFDKGARLLADLQNREQQKFNSDQVGHAGHTNEQLNTLMEQALGRGPASVEDENDLAGFVASTLSAAGPEFFGSVPNRYVQRFRDRNPVGGFTSTVLGASAPFAIPFVGQGALGVRLAAALPGAARLVKFAAAADKVGIKPFSSGFAKGAASILPLEAVRLAGASIGDEGDLRRAAEGAAFDVAIFGGLGGAGQWIKSTVAARGSIGSREGLGAKSSVRLERELLENLPDFRVQGYDPTMPRQEKIRAWRKFKNQKAFEDDTDVLALNELIGKLQQEIYTEVPVEGLFVRPLEQATFGPEAFGGVNQIFAGVKGKFKSLKAHVDDFEGAKKPVEELLTTFRKNLGRNFEADVQFPRELVPDGPQGRTLLNQSLRKNMRNVGDGLWMARESNKGHFAMVKEIQVPLEKGTGAFAGRPFIKPNRFLAFKTHNPRKFAPREDAALEVVMSPYRTMPDFFADKLDDSVPWLRHAANAHETVGTPAPLLARTPETTRNSIGGLVTRGGEKVLGENMERLRKATADKMRAFPGATVQEWLTPTAMQFRNSALGQSMWSTVNTTMGRVVGATTDDVFGQLVRHTEGSPVGNLLKVQRSGGLDETIRAAYNPEAMMDSHLGLMRTMLDLLDGNKQKLIDEGVNAKTLKAAEDVMEFMQRLATETVSQNAVLSHTPVSASVTAQLPRHITALFMRGRHRIPIKTVDDRIVGYATGANGKAAKEEYFHIIDEVNKLKPRTLSRENPKDIIGTIPDKRTLKEKGLDEIQSDFDRVQLLEVDHENPLVRQILRAQLDLLESKGIIGAFGQRQAGRALRNEFTQTLYGNAIGTRKKLAQDALENVLQKDRVRLGLEDPDTLKIFNERFDAAASKRSGFAQAQARAFNTILEPLFGADAADEAVRKMNRAIFSLTLGAGDVGFAVLNVVTPIQTAFPELAWFIGAPPSRVAQYYSPAVVQGMKAGTRQVSYLDPFKVMKNAIKDVFSDDQEIRDAIKFAFHDGTVAPVFVEQSARFDAPFKTMKEIFSGKGSITESFTQLSEFMPAKTEEFSRMVAYLAGRRMAKDVLGLEGEELIHGFSRRFVHNTMFGYGLEDRAKLFTGALGSGFGLFKTWSTAYMHNIARYAGDAMYRGQYAPLTYAMGASGAIGGVGAVPAFGLADWASRKLTDDSFVTNLYETLGGEDGTLTSDFVAHGFPSLVGLSLQGRAAAPFADPVMDAKFATTMASWDRMAAMKDMFGEAIDSWFLHGKNPAQDPRVRDAFIRGFAPRTVQKGYQTWGGNLRSLRNGNNLTSNLSVFDQIAHTVGISPIKIQQSFEIRDELEADAEEQRNQIALFGDAIATAELNGDWQKGHDLRTQAGLQGLAIDSVSSSAATRVRNQREDAIIRSYEAARVDGQLRLRGRSLSGEQGL